MNKIAVLLLATALLAGPVSAGAPPAKADSDKIICRKEGEIGSRFTRERCFTAAQWAEIRRRSRELVEHLQQIADIAGAR